SVLPVSVISLHSLHDALPIFSPPRTPSPRVLRSYGVPTPSGTMFSASSGSHLHGFRNISDENSHKGLLCKPSENTVGGIVGRRRGRSRPPYGERTREKDTQCAFQCPPRSRTTSSESPSRQPVSTSSSPTVMRSPCRRGPAKDHSSPMRSI